MRRERSVRVAELQQRKGALVVVSAAPFAGRCASDSLGWFMGSPLTPSSAVLVSGRRGAQERKRGGGRERSRTLLGSPSLSTRYAIILTAARALRVRGAGGRHLRPEA